MKTSITIEDIDQATVAMLEKFAGEHPMPLQEYVRVALAGHVYEKLMMQKRVEAARAFVAATTDG